MKHVLSFDVEEYFQVANFTGIFPRDSWDSIDSRLHVGMERILRSLEAHGSRATFFFLGWIAERHPDWVRRCLEGGHEIASHGYEHLFLQELGAEGLDSDLEKTEEALIAAGAERPLGFRASTFTLTRETWWAIDVLVRRGYRYDSSIHPVTHPTYGIADFEPGISRVKSTGGGEIVEFPVSTLRFAGKNLPVGGGGYFRLLPGAVTERALRAIERAGRPAALYFHPWEFDPEQPRVAASALKRFRHYLNLDRTLPRLERMMKRFEFGTMTEALTQAGFDVAEPSVEAR